MREVKIDAWCDWCWRNDEQRTPALAVWNLSMGEGESPAPARLLELCEEHLATAKQVRELWETLPPLSSKAPAPPPPRPKYHYEPPPKDCPVCQQHFEGTNPSGALMVHVWRDHRKEPKPPQPPLCPDCGHRAYSGTGMANHRRGAHGYDSLAEALDGVRGFKMQNRSRTAARKTAEQPALDDAQ